MRRTFITILTKGKWTYVKILSFKNEICSEYAVKFIIIIMFCTFSSRYKNVKFKTCGTLNCIWWNICPPLWLDSAPASIQSNQNLSMKYEPTSLQDIFRKEISLGTNAPSEDSDQLARRRKLICVIAGRCRHTCSPGNTYRSDRLNGISFISVGGGPNLPCIYTWSHCLYELI